jgi:hypothetical protein
MATDLHLSINSERLVQFFMKYVQASLCVLYIFNWIMLKVGDSLLIFV